MTTESTKINHTIQKTTIESSTDNDCNQLFIENRQETTFLKHVQQIVNQKSNTIFASWHNESGKIANQYTFSKLWDEAGCVAYHLRQKYKLQKGDLVVLCYDFGLHFFAAFLGCLRAGITAVLVYPPGPPLIKSLTKLTKVVEDCHPVLILTDSKINLLRKADINNPFSKSRHLWPKNINFKVTSNIKLDSKHFDEPNLLQSDLAFLQYTSGSTGDPKGVMVTFSALHANVNLLSGGYHDAFERDGKAYYCLL